MPFVEMIRQYREAGLKPKVCRSTLGSVYTPTMKTVLELKRVPTIQTVNDADAAVIDKLDRYNVLFSHTQE